MPISWETELTQARSVRLRELLAAIYAADGRPMLTGSGIPDEIRAGRKCFAERADGTLLGFAYFEGSPDAFGRAVAELFVHPEHRNTGVGEELTGALLDDAGIAAGDGDGDRLRVWSHGDHPAAAAIARNRGFTRARELLRMRLDLSAAELPEPVLPDGARLRTFVPGRDEQALIEVNRRAFDWHPEQGELSVADLMREENEDWFDAAGFFLAERDERLIGFHWTKVHERVVADDSGEPVGEVYVVGVDPGAQGGGLGRALTIAGLRHLRQRGLHTAMLYVESDNPAAVRVYERIGFRVWDVDVQYSH